MTTAISDPFTYPEEKEATDADHGPMGVALCQALLAAGLTKVSGPTTLAEWETASFANDATTVWDFNDTVAGVQSHLYVRFTLYTASSHVTAHQTGWDISVSDHADFPEGRTLTEKWAAGLASGAGTRPGARYLVSFSESCLAAHVDWPKPSGQTAVSPNGIAVERSRDGNVPNGESIAYLRMGPNRSWHKLNVLDLGLMPATYVATANDLTDPLGDMTGAGKLSVSPISWFDHTGLRRTLAGAVLVPKSLGARQILEVHNAGTSRTYITARDQTEFRWGGSAVPSPDRPMTAALRWE